VRTLSSQGGATTSQAETGSRVLKAAGAPGLRSKKPLTFFTAKSQLAQKTSVNVSTGKIFKKLK
jgi:hypothetical protein